MHQTSCWHRDAYLVSAALPALRPRPRPHCPMSYTRYAGETEHPTSFLGTQQHEVTERSKNTRMLKTLDAAMIDRPPVSVRWLAVMYRAVFI